MKINEYKKSSFVTIGKQGSTIDGPNFVQNLWKDANSHFNEVQHLARKDEFGNLVGIWGNMSDFSMSFQPWQNNFSKGYYLAGVECMDDAIAPDGWTRWVIPGFDYLRVECEEKDTFNKMIEYISQQNLSLVGAVQDFTDPKNGKNYMLFPIKK